MFGSVLSTYGGVLGSLRLRMRLASKLFFRTLTKLKLDEMLRFFLAVGARP